MNIKNKRQKRRGSEMIMSNKKGYYPRQAVWEMTLRCNMNCMHCGSRAGKARQDE